MMKPKIVSTAVVASFPGMDVIECKVKFENDIAIWHHIKSRNGIAIVPVDADGFVYLAKEWRSAHDDYVTQVPTGGCGTNEEEIMQQAKNELMEEIGMCCNKLEKLAVLKRGSRISANISVYLATDLYPAKRKCDVHEYITVVKMPLLQAIDYFTSKEITVSHTLAALLLAKERLAHDVVGKKISAETA